MEETLITIVSGLVEDKDRRTWAGSSASRAGSPRLYVQSCVRLPGEEMRR